MEKREDALPAMHARDMPPEPPTFCGEWVKIMTLDSESAAGRVNGS